MVVTRSQSKAASKATKHHSTGDSEDDVVLLGSAALGRGCRERRTTEFFTVEQPTRRTKPHPSSHSPPNDDDDDHTVIRRPQREAAKNALNRLRETLSNDVDDIEPPTTTQRRKAAGRHAARQTSQSSVEVSSEDGSDDSDASGTTDTSNGLIDHREASQLERMYAKNKSKPINTFLGKLFGGKKKGNQGDSQDVRERKRGREEEGGDEKMERKGLGDITPLPVDPSITLESVGGLPNHVIALREMVIVPLLYPQLLQQFHITPPRGVLFVGPPGTGKTLMARALANEGMIGGERRITFFVRKGADILSKWVGESEKQLRLLFDEARRRAPSIIFFDELDGLAPVRHSKQEQSHACLVSTLLALMDGIDSRGQVIVIGATNRPDTIDPALRRPGRFDRELYFPLPDAAARRHIISIHTKEQLHNNPEKKLIEEDLLRSSEGWSGADIAAVCTEASLHALRASVPQIFVCSHRLVLPALQNLHVGLGNFQAAIRRLQPALFRSAAAALAAPPIDEHLEALCAEEKSRLVDVICRSFAPAATALKELERRCDDTSAAMRQLLSVPLPASRRALYCCPTSTSPVVARLFASVIAKTFPSFFCRTVHLPNLGLAEEAQCGEGASHVENIASIVDSARATSPSILLLLGIDEWLASQAEDAQQSLMYNLMRLEEHDVLVLCPVVDKSLWLPLLQRSRRQQKSICILPIEPIPSADSRKTFFRRLHDTCATCLELNKATKTWPALPVDTTPLPQPKVPRAERSAVWERLQYKRRQLRHILKKWMTQFVTQPRFSILLSADLDMTEATHPEQLKRWRKHTHGKRMGLMDIMEKLENEEYVSLSQYNDDIDQMVRNVRTFFSTWSKEDQRYRSRAAEVKDTTVLNMYKINKNVVSYCEQHAHLVDEPTSSDDDDDDEADAVEQTPQKALLDASPEVKQPRPADNLTTPSRGASSNTKDSTSGLRTSSSSGSSSGGTAESIARGGRKGSQQAQCDVPATVLTDSARVTYEGLRNVMSDVLDQSRAAMRAAKAADVWKIIATCVADASKV